MDIPDHLRSLMAEKTDEQLISLFAGPQDWTPEALHAAQAELIKRNIDLEKVKPAAPASEEETDLPGQPSEDGGINYRQQANIGIPSGWILNLVGGALIRTERDPVMLYTGHILALAGVGMVIWGAAGFAMGKGYSKWLGALGLLSCIGIAVIALLPDRRKEYDDHTS